MTTTHLITALEESTGKTAVSLAIAKIARERGETVGYMKPKGTRLESRVGKTLDRDPLLAAEVLDLEDEIADLEPVVYSPTFIRQAIRGREDPAALRERVREAHETLATDRDRMFIEGGGRYDLGGIVDLTDPVVAAELDAQAVLVAPYERPGDVDAVLAAKAAFGDRLDGVLFNGVAPSERADLEDDVAPFLERRDLPVVGIVPHDRELAGVTVADLASEIGGDLVVSEGADTFVERFTVGAMRADSALSSLRRRRNTALITGGDRTDIQRAALEASSVQCLILSGGHHPPGHIVARATEAGLPIVVVQTDTLTTVERAEAVVSSGRTRDAWTVERVETLLRDHAALDAILGV